MSAADFEEEDPRSVRDFDDHDGAALDDHVALQDSEGDKDEAGDQDMAEGEHVDVENVVGRDNTAHWQSRTLHHHQTVDRARPAPIYIL